MCSNFFLKFGVRSGSDPGPIRVRSTNFFAKKFVDRIRVGPGISKKIRTPLSTFESPVLIYNYSAPGGCHRIPISHRTEKFSKNWFTFINVQSHLFIEIVDWKCGSDPEFQKKNRTAFISFETQGLICNYSAPGGSNNIPISHWTVKSKKLWFTSFDVQSHFSKTLIKYA